MAKIHQPIDWFSWLSKTGLDPSLIYEYGMAFSRNELEEDDIAYFNHELLQSIGISIAKHRLEILKLASKQKGLSGSHPVSRLAIAIKKTKRSLASYIRTLVHRDESALVLVRKGYGSRWEGNMLRRNKRFVTYKQSTPTLLLTNGNHESNINSVRPHNFFSPLVYRYDQEKKGDYGDEDSGGGVKEIKWDTMFKNLKPT
ncbi:uncharacterized protein LOC143544570 [Bidens hawaiensis]|uniref:uncharacterized protein LOC143544570 n=1 Tax=Bidens hawaiensis TaxID=980011 RepID=UPI00404A2C52